MSASNEYLFSADILRTVILVPITNLFSFLIFLLAYSHLQLLLHNEANQPHAYTHPSVLDLFPRTPPSPPQRAELSSLSYVGFPGGEDGKESTCQCKRSKRRRFNSWVGKISWRRNWQPTPVFLPGEFHGQRSLAGYSPWGCKESDTTEQLSPQAHTAPSPT